MAFVLEHLRERHPGRPIGVIGFSLGGNVLLRFLGAREAEARFLGACVAISVPFDLEAGARMLEETRAGRFYGNYFLRSLKGKARAKQRILAPVVDLARVLGARTIREFDEAATAPLHGFPSAEEYYREASSAPVVSRVRVPTLILHAADDPFLPPEAIPRKDIDRNPWTLGAVTPRGGHVGFVEGGSGATRFWAEREAARYLGEVLGR
ncbi:MAG: alpha/beta fold hydrolase [Gemmatimonadetes bacterium]|nr:alpha/beta fold hydrolase [Gemmatimonadota bacterium]